MQKLYSEKSRRKIEVKKCRHWCEKLLSKIPVIL
jgi:hypothetical protein